MLDAAGDLPTGDVDRDGERVADLDVFLVLVAGRRAEFDRAELQLAKNVELLLARNSYLPLVKSGATMPKEGEVQRETFHLYCTDPRDGVAKFQFFAPAKSGRSILPNDPRNYLGNLTVKVDSKAKIYRERLELDIGIKHRWHKHVLLAVEGGTAHITDRIPLEAAGLNPRGNFFTFQTRLAYEF